VTEYRARTRGVYLPSGTGWYDLKSGAYYQGGRTIKADAPYTEIPVFVREGTILPCGPELQFTDEKAADPIRLFVYTGSDGSFTLYEDENVNYNYEKGLFATISLSYSEKTKVLTFGKRGGSFPGMLPTRTFEVVWLGEEKKSGLNFESKPDAVVTYDGNRQSIRLK
jgi:alpha-D-xyloside xylohydrolase